MKAIRTSACLAMLCGIQYIFPNLAHAQTWTASTNAPSKEWWAVASSADGEKLVAVIDILSTSGEGGIYSSTNGGGTWTPTSAPANLHTWDSVSCSADGGTIVASGSQALTRQIYTSADSGNTWTLTSAPNLSWYSVACSSNGTKMVALAWQTNVIYTSADSGATWVSNAIPNNWWGSVASSADGTKLVAAAQTPSGVIYTSTNSGGTWMSNNVPDENWLSVASSADGSFLAAVAPTVVCTSANFGQTWTTNNVPAYYWSSVAASSDGSRLVAVAATGQIYTAAPPSLSLTLSNATLTLLWPASASGFQLQQNPNLTSGGWTGVTNSILVTNNQSRVTISITNTQNFYRLQSPP